VSTELIDRTERSSPVPKNWSPRPVGDLTRDICDPEFPGVFEHRMGPTGHIRYFECLGRRDAVVDTVEDSLVRLRSHGDGGAGPGSS